MLSKIIPNLFDIYTELLTYNNQPLNLSVLDEKDFCQETALILISKCEKLIKEGEYRVIGELKNMQENLRIFFDRITKYESFECDCKNTMRLIHLHSKDRNGLANRLPKIQKDVKFLRWLMIKTVEAIFETHKQPNNLDLIVMKKVKFVKLVEMLSEKKLEYAKFVPSFARLSNYLDSKLQINPKRMSYLNEAQQYLDGKSDTFLSFLQRDDEELIEKTFGSFSSTQEVKNLLRNSLKEVMNKSSTDLEETTDPNELMKEVSQLEMDLSTFYKYMTELEEGIIYFHHLDVPSDLLYLQKCQLNLQRFKRDLRKLRRMKKCK